jgi:phage/conjugal plasmid C-4 type zinc finger TraR family protein
MLEKLFILPISMALERDTDMANGWAQDGAVQDQIDDTVADAVEAARARLLGGEAALYCEQCGEDIPEARRQALPGARTCIACQSDRDAKIRSVGINRRGSKDSQLR